MRLTVRNVLNSKMHLTIGIYGACSHACLMHAQRLHYLAVIPKSRVGSSSEECHQVDGIVLIL